MPLFEYRCSKCQHEFEALVRGQERVACPRCHEDDLEKLLSAAAARTGTGGLPIASACPPAGAPPCSPNCCRLP